LVYLRIEILAGGRKYGAAAFTVRINAVEREARLVHQHGFVRLGERTDDHRDDLGFTRTTHHALGVKTVFFADGDTQVLRGPVGVQSQPGLSLLDGLHRQGRGAIRIFRGRQLGNIARGHAVLLGDVFRRQAWDINLAVHQRLVACCHFRTRHHHLTLLKKDHDNSMQYYSNWCTNLYRTSTINESQDFLRNVAWLEQGYTLSPPCAPAAGRAIGVKNTSLMIKCTAITEQKSGPNQRVRAP